jgi:hypothetical protein
MDNLHYPEDLYEVNSELFKERIALKIDSFSKNLRIEIDDIENHKAINRVQSP